MPITPISTSALVVRVRDLLADTPYSTTSSTTGTGSTVTVVDGTKWSEGDIGEWQTGTVGFEQFLVTADPVGNDLTVARGYNGTTAETHANGDRVFQGPAFSGRNIQQSLNGAIRSLWPFVYRTEDISVTPVAGQLWYDVTAPLDDALGIVSVTQKTGTAPGLDYFRYLPKHGLRFDPEADTTVVASGQALKIPYLVHATNTIKVKVQEAVTGDNDIEDNSLFPVADYLIVAAAAKLTGASEIPRVASGADLETTGSVGTGARSDLGRTLAGQAKQMLGLLTITYREHYRPIFPGR